MPVSLIYWLLLSRSSMTVRSRGKPYRTYAKPEMPKNIRVCKSVNAQYSHSPYEQARRAQPHRTDHTRIGSKATLPLSDCAVHSLFVSTLHLAVQPIWCDREWPHLDWKATHQRAKRKKRCVLSARPSHILPVSPRSLSCSFPYPSELLHPSCNAQNSI